MAIIAAMAQKPACHTVSTLPGARALIASHQRFWLAECACRKNRRGCSRSKRDVCLFFHPESCPEGLDIREVSRDEIDEILAIAGTQHLVPRPFTDSPDNPEIRGICFCCDDCCDYFQKRTERSEKGPLIESSRLPDCISCGACVDVCHFEARQIVDIKLAIDRDLCFGCGLCADVCPMHCITMVPREG